MPIQNTQTNNGQNSAVIIVPSHSQVT